MSSLVINKIIFPEFSGVRCNMMPFIQGDPDSIPNEYKPYSVIIESNFLDKGKIGYLTIDESFVNCGKTQRGYNSKGIDRNVHIEVGRHINLNRWGGSGGENTWGKSFGALLDDETMVLIANSIDDTCRIWDAIEMSPTDDGDLSDYIDRYPVETGILLKSGELAKISIFTPHECISQKESGYRQFIRIVGDGVSGKDQYWTDNPLLN